MRNDHNGFTLVELLVAMAISSIMLAVIVVTYQSQAQTHITQQEVVDMQQNARAAMDLMTREIRMAGLNPTGNAGTGTPKSMITAADANCLEFGMDMSGDGDTNDTNEQYRYKLTNDGTSACGDGNGIADSFPCALGRRTGGGLQVVADNIEALNFAYLDANGAVIPTPVSAANLPNIRSVQVTLIARADNPVMMRKATDRKVYKNQQGTILLDKSASPDTVRRLELSTTIQCRNLGL